MTTIASKNPDVFILMSGAVQCTQAIQEAAENGMKETAKYLFTSQNCKSASYVSKEKVGGDGVGVERLVDRRRRHPRHELPGRGRQPLRPVGPRAAAIGRHRPQGSGNNVLGFQYSFPLIQAIRIAGELDGGVTRSNVILALRAMDMTHPMLLDGIKFNMSGNKDAYLIEGSDLSKYDSAKQQWIQQGDIIDLSGKSQLCAFDQSTSSCK